MRFKLSYPGHFFPRREEPGHTDALIGVQIAAYYPDISLSAPSGFESSMVSKLFNTASGLWSLRATGAETLFSGGGDGGARDL